MSSLYRLHMDNTENKSHNSSPPNSLACWLLPGNELEHSSTETHLSLLHVGTCLPSRCLETLWANPLQCFALLCLCFLMVIFVFLTSFIYCETQFYVCMYVCPCDYHKNYSYIFSILYIYIYICVCVSVFVNLKFPQSLKGKIVPVLN
jgi:hypothetical protein